ncbi:Aste57867_3601 [Aphanomyces stellatus]|uniref:Aste57867_3601 protein n=1 Tax=Aphanomyces stellatus TaxID=120398 RepID=A0A485KA12_9STRA|nr:hypothetical protein As57867_003590 [Aphanomyces stellatus]VFT80762.1 Aste57867_3601 [Aphanomyces stellatus]
MLSLIHDVERRATLFLRIARAQPFIKSACCQADLCFNCKTCGHHKATPCSALINTTEAMGSCPNCNLTLVKGDGCDWITCFCGRGFYWTHGLRCFRWSLATPRQKQLVLVAIVRPAIHSYRIRKVVLPALVQQVKLCAVAPHFRHVLSYLRAQVAFRRERIQTFAPQFRRVVDYLRGQVLAKQVKRTMATAVLPALQQKVILLDIAKQANSMRRVCEYLRCRMWRTKYHRAVLFSSEFHMVCLKNVVASTPRLMAAMATFTKVAKQRVVRWRLQRVLVEAMSKARWRYPWLNVSEEDKAHIADEMFGILAIDVCFYDEAEPGTSD